MNVDYWNAAKLPKYSGKQELFLLHIPKTGGTSLNAEFKKLKLRSNKNQSVHVGSGEFCFEQSQMHNRFSFTIMRSPRSHVISQFMHMFTHSHSKNGVHTHGYPHQYDDRSIDKELEHWLDHFEYGKWKLENGSYADPSYNPRNLQTRVLANLQRNDNCHSEKVFVERTDKELFFKSLLDAMENLSKLNLVGLTELYPESICLLVHIVADSLPDYCGKCNAETGNIVNHAESHVTHGVKAPTEKDFDRNTIHKIDQLTSNDRALYAYGVREFCRAVITFQRETGIKRLICPKRVQEFKLDTAYITELWGAAEQSMMNFTTLASEPDNSFFPLNNVIPCFQ